MSVRVGLATFDFPFDSARSYLDWVELCDQSGIDSLWLSDRLVTSDLRLEPLVALGVVAGRTERIKFGMNVVVLPARDPLVLASQCATLDFLSDGRLLPAFGIGGPDMFAATGRDPGERGRRADEMLQLMTRLWVEDEVDFRGSFYSYSGISLNPRPVQKEFPVWIGGHSAAAVRRTARYGTGWLAGLLDAAEAAPVVEAIKTATAAEGRAIDDDHFGGGFAYHLGSADGPAIQRAIQIQQQFRPGSPHDAVTIGRDAIIEKAQEFVTAGMSKFILRPVAADSAGMREQVTRLVDDVIPAIHGLTPHP